MRRIFCFTLLALTIASFSTIAQSDCYSHDTAYVVGNMNIRESATTDSPVVATARAGDSFTVSQSQRGPAWCWLNVGEGWMAKTSRVSATPPTNPSTSPVDQTQSPAQQESDIDNCCFLNWQCSTNWQWTNGYWAFQNNQCAMPEHSAQPQMQSSEQQSSQQYSSQQQEQQEAPDVDDNDSDGDGVIIVRPLTPEEWCEISWIPSCDDLSQ